MQLTSAPPFSLTQAERTHSLGSVNKHSWTTKMTLHPRTPSCPKEEATHRGRDFQPGLLGLVLFADLQPQLHKDRDSSPGAGFPPCLSCLVQCHCATGQLCLGSTGTIHSVGTESDRDRTWPAVRRSGQRSFPLISHTGIKRSTEYFAEHRETRSSWNSLWCLEILVKN